MAGFGQGNPVAQTGVCFACREQMTGTKEGIVGGAGFGSTRRKGTVACCVNPNCSEGRKNLAEKAN